MCKVFRASAHFRAVERLARFPGLIGLITGTVQAVFAPDRPPSETEPGLLAEYRSLTEKSALPLRRIDAKPSFTWGQSSPHPRLPVGRFEVVWTGRIDLDEEEELRFAAFLDGEVRVVVDGEEVLKAEGIQAWRESAKRLRRTAGFYPIQIIFHSGEGSAARLQLWWRGKSFSAEPIPAYRFQHSVANFSEGWRLDAQRERGRVLVGQLGCDQCHREAFPATKEPAPGPSLKDIGNRVGREWLQDWLENPRKILPHARMPALFSADRNGYVERALLAEYLLEEFCQPEKVPNEKGDHRSGRQSFVGLGCATCHYLPEDSDTPGAGKFSDMYQDRLPLKALGDRFNLEQLAQFVGDPRTRYPDGRMPRLPMSEETARDISAYLLLWSKPSEAKPEEPPRSEEIKNLARRLATSLDRHEIAAALIREKRCAACHSDLGSEKIQSVALRATDLSQARKGCLSEGGSPHFVLDDQSREAIGAYALIAATERFASAFDENQRELIRAQCFRCHQGDSTSASPIEEIGKTLWTPHLMRLAYQRTPPLNQAFAKYTREHLLESIREGVSGIRPGWYSYKMPIYGELADKIVEALAAKDGEGIDPAAPRKAEPSDPTLSTLGATLLGFEGYSCVSCHLWKGKELTSVDPGAVGPELTSVSARINPDWFARWLENPPRQHPGTPMPAFFQKGKPAPINSVLDGQVSRQMEAIWAFLSLGTNAPDLAPKTFIPVVLPRPEDPPLVAQIPITLARGETLESICLQFGTDDLAIYDVPNGTLHSYRRGSQILRNPNGWRTFVLSDTDDVWSLAAEHPIQLLDANGQSLPTTNHFAAYELLPDGVRIQSRVGASCGVIQFSEDIRIPKAEPRRLLRRFQAHLMPGGYSVQLRLRMPEQSRLEPMAKVGRVELSSDDKVLKARLAPESEAFDVTLSYSLPPPAKAKLPPVSQVDPASLLGSDQLEDQLVRAGYRAIRYPMPKTRDREDRVMPSALAVDPKTGRLFVASLKLGELFVLHDPKNNGEGAFYQDYCRGLFQEAYSMLHDGEALYLLHRRNLTRILDTDGDGLADRFERVAPLQHNPGNTYDWAYGLVREAADRFIVSLAPYADNKNLPGMGGVLRLTTGSKGVVGTEIASGLRNAFGWAAGPGGQVFFTDNQGDWVPANKLGHLIEGKNYGYPNTARPDLVRGSPDSAAVWVPYGWAKSLNGITYDGTQGKFGPFAGQFFLAELMHGGGIIRANVERINGNYQGACFPFWGKGLLGPLALTHDLRGRLWVGSITQPGWMAQRDQGGLFRIEYTGDLPFEIQSIHVRPKGFRLVFTKPVSVQSATHLASYAVEQYHYEFSGAYGSPELDKTPVSIERVELSPDKMTVELTIAPLIAHRIYSITASGLRSAFAEALVHSKGVYTLNALPSE